MGPTKAVNTCKLLGLDGIVAIGGDWYLPGRSGASKHGIAVVGIPGTIDEDIVCTEYTIGFDTAANTAVECIDRLRTLCSPMSAVPWWRLWAVGPGYLALYVAMAVGATAVLVPEVPYDFDTQVVEKIRRAAWPARQIS